jgi:small GTP-binding protein
MPPPATIAWSVLTPRAPGAIAIIALQGEPARLDQTLAALSIPSIPIGATRVATLRAPAPDHEPDRPILDRPILDRAVVARFSPNLIHIMAHGGPLIVDAITAALELMAIPQLQTPAAEDALRNLYPEAADLHEARVVHALAHAASPLAIDILLDQSRRWRLADVNRLPRVSPDSARRLRHLLTPALVVAIGPSNVGKSSLINALAGRDAAIVADEPGTTRDHVGVHLDLSGLVVRWLDTPGVRDHPDAIEREAIDLALSVADSADLLILCDDLAAHFSPPQHAPRLMSFLAATRVPTLRVGLRADLCADRAREPSQSPPPNSPQPALRVSIHDRASLDALAALVRTTLLGSALADPGAWPFWE